MFRREMHDDDKSEPAVGRHVGEELLERRDPAGGGAEADDGRGFVRVEPFLRAVARVLGRRVGRGGIDGLRSGLRHE